MHITYFLKKGFQFFPPCLAEILYLNDLGVDLLVYHGTNTEYINALLDERGIVHKTLKSDNNKKGKAKTIRKFLSYREEVKHILVNIPNTKLLWFGNCESIMSLKGLIDKYKFVLTVLELYDNDAITDAMLKQVIKKATIVTCCEKHRAFIMRSRYQLNRTPYVMPNKPYEFASNENVDNDSAIREMYLQQVADSETKKVVLYQGIISKDRPLESIAEALSMINDDNIVFVVMGKGDISLIETLKRKYKNVKYLGYIPSPQHLTITKLADIGIVNYDYSCLNNVFCAPNKIYEYSKFSLPMLAAENIGLSETVGVCGAAECVDFGDINAVKIGLEKIMSNLSQYKENAYGFYSSTNNKATIQKILLELQK